VAYKRILLGTDGSPQAAQAGRVAAALAKAGKAELVVTHVWERPEGAEERLAKTVEELREAGVKKLDSELHGARAERQPQRKAVEGAGVGDRNLERGYVSGKDRLHAGSATVEGLTTHLGMAAEVSAEIARLVAAHDETERVLKVTSPSPGLRLSVARPSGSH
jgi:hypothetical protein